MRRNSNEREARKRALDKQRDLKLKQAREAKRAVIDAIWAWYDRELARIEKETQ